MKEIKVGFTLIELLVVVTIIAILSGAAMVSFSAAGRSARDARRQADIQNIRQSLVMYRNEFGCYPNVSSIDDVLKILNDEGYISEPYPVDPKNNSTYYYEYTPFDSATCLNGDSGARGFLLSAYLENSDLPYQLRNP